MQPKTIPADIAAHWQALLDRRNPQPAEPVPMSAYVCAKCAGTFERPVGRPPPKQCPICGARHWDDPTAKRRRRRP